MKTISLSGFPWKARHFIPEKERPSSFEGMKITYFDNIFLPDGLAAGAHLPEYDERGWFDTTIPKDVHDILLDAGEIPDPLYGQNALKTKWVSEQEWWFRCAFTIPGEDLSKHPVRYLRFEGLDLHATIWLNGENLGESHDMFTPVEFRVEEILKTDAPNLVAVRIAPQIDSHCGSYWGDKKEKASVREFKCQSSYGWDWVRTINSLGIWKDVQLHAHAGARLKRVILRPEISDDLASGKVAVDAAIDIFEDNDYSLAARVFAPDGAEVARAESTPENGRFAFSVEVGSVEPWWPVCIGKPSLYRIELELRNGDAVIDSTSKQIGFRKIEKRYNPGTTEDNAYPHTFTINNLAIFIRGGNWAPMDVFPARLTRDDYRGAIQTAVDHSVNMFRIWGGGLQENDDFFELCDEFGVLVWQEFPMACSLYPTDAEWLNDFRRVARNSVERLHAHPSIVQWCGGNEMLGYGMQPDHPALSICEEEVRRVLPDIPFAKACDDEKDLCPHGPWNIVPRWNLSTYIDHKYWNDKVIPFCSESGCDGMANLDEYSDFCPEDERYMLSRTLRYHFASSAAYEQALKKQFRAETFEEWVLASQWLAADMIRYIVGHFRRQRPASSGVMIWSYNEPWKSCGWAMLGYGNVVRPALTAFAEAAAPTALSVRDENMIIEDELNVSIWVHHDRIEPFSGKVRIELSTASGTLHQTEIETGELEYGDNKEVHKITYDCSAIDELIRLELVMGDYRTRRLYGNRKAWASREVFRALA